MLGGCFRQFHLRVPVTIKVVDGLTGLPAEGALITQKEWNQKFRPTIDRSRAFTGPDGCSRFVLLSGLDGSYWQILAGDPMLPENLEVETGRFFNGRGFSQIPSEFKEISKDFYIAPLWPALDIVIELPQDFIGMIAEVKLAEDSPDGRGWKPPLSVSEGAARRAVVRPDAHGVVSYPGTIAGVQGFDFQAGRNFRRNEVWINPTSPWDSIAPRKYVDGKIVNVPIDPLEVHAWTIAIEDRPEELLDVTRVTFVGSLVDLRAWIVANSLVSGKNSRLKYEPVDVAALRHFTAKSLLKLVPIPEPVVPEWHERKQNRWKPYRPNPTPSPTHAPVVRL